MFPSHKLTQDMYIHKNVFVELHIPQIDQVTPKRLAELSHFRPGAGDAVVEVQAAASHLCEGAVALELWGAKGLRVLPCFFIIL